MSARIDNVQWNAATGVSASRSNGFLSIGGSDPINNLGFSIAASGPGAYVIPGSGALGVGNNALLIVTTNGVANSSWTADILKGSGSVTISSLTETTVTGTFSFVLNAVTGTAATGTKTLTNGTFSIRF